ncbi:tetratricopeptide repeat protein [Chamaesiphon sp. GL140_3_metabinner_50]|uniref:tetratricopeptide repeat protein n=1 Tax=Chamaesiphon sp. GL140_3_metabinner_50 TaxID=2970812 RepID=UPI0025E0B17E|nr:tetratricopeptide repeat protein [Chamaesiphon sp. GL140_3_metabinner_50]
MPQFLYAPVKDSLASDIISSANLKYKQGDYLESLTAYNEAIQIEPDNAMAFCCRGVAYYRLGDEENAKIDYNRSIELDPTLAVAYYRRGFLRYVAKEYVMAIADYNKSIELNPTFALAYSNRGYVYRDLYGEQEAAIDWRFAAKLFKEQGNIKKYQSTMNVLNQIIDMGSWGSGML